MNIFQKSLALLVSWSLVIGTVWGGAAYASQSDQSEAQPTDSGSTQSPEELQQLVAPVALYPDALVSQILAGATVPTEIVEANRWIQGHPNLQGQELANEVDKQPWDPSVKALTQFLSELANRQEPLLDFLAGRCLRKPAAGRNGCGAGDARWCAKSGEFEEQ